MTAHLRCTKIRSEWRLRFAFFVVANAVTLSPFTSGHAAVGGIDAWEWLGPGNISGRIRAIAVDSINPQNILVGCAAGGIWRSTNGGVNWSPSDAGLTSRAISCLLPHPADPTVVFAGTGEGYLAKNARLDGTPGDGVFYTATGGLVWIQIPSTAGWANDPDDRFVNRLAAAYVDGDFVLLAATNGHIYRSVNSGAFQPVYDGWVTDLEFLPNGIAVASLMTFCDDINCPTYDPAQPVVSAMYSLDGGENWFDSAFSPGSATTLMSAATSGSTQLSVSSTSAYGKYDLVRVGGAGGEIVQITQHPSGSSLSIQPQLTNDYGAGGAVELMPSRRCEIAVHVGSPNVIYAFMGASYGSLWKSTDDGQTFQFVSNPPENPCFGSNGFPARSHYDIALWVSPDNPDVLAIGGVELYRSVNGGVDFSIISNGRGVTPGTDPHNDQHVILEHPQLGPQGKRKVYFGTDGGLFATDDILAVGPSSGWINLNSGLGGTQFYSGAATISQDHQWFLGGGQDNGRPNLHVAGGASADVDGWMYPFDDDCNPVPNGKGDDLYGVAIDASDPANPIFFAAQTGLNLKRSTDGGCVWEVVAPPNRSGARTLAPYLVDPDEPFRVIAGSRRVHRSEFSGDSWEIIGDPISPGSPAISAIDVTATNPESYWVGYEDGRILVTEQGRAAAATVLSSWQDRGSGLPARVVTDIAVSALDPDVVFTTYEATASGPLDTVWFSCDGGVSWEIRVGGGQNSLPRERVLTVRLHANDVDRVYVGTDSGVYASDDRGLNWTKVSAPGGSSGPHELEVYQLSWQGDQYLVAATNGRGMFRTEPAVRPPQFLDVAASVGASDGGNSEGAAWGDYDGDGDLDLYVTNHSNQSNRLFRNDGGSFTDVTEQTGTGGMANTSAAVWGDFDNDGDPDLYVSDSGSANLLYRNDGPSGFVDVAGTAGVADDGLGRGTAWADYDNDGLLDLYLANNGENKLYRNLNGLQFADVTVGALGDSGPAQGVAWGDYDGDGDQDLYVANWSGVANVLLRNDGGSFTDISASSNTAGNETSNGVAWGDYDGDGDLDLYVNNSGTNRLYRNDGGDSFSDVAAALGADDPGNGRGVSWQDYDNDGDLDLYLGNFTGVANRLFRNEGCARFTDVSGITGTGDASATREGVWGDFDQNGELDLYVTNAGANRLYHNLDGVPEGNHWLQVDLVGGLSNRSGIGARIIATAGGVSQMREVSGGSGLYSQNSITAEFGFAREITSVEALEIRWPSGAVQLIPDVALDQRITVTEVCEGCPTGTDGPPPRVERTTLHPGIPNPFNPSTMLRFELAEAASVWMRIYDAAGRTVRTMIADESYPVGTHSVVWRGLDDGGSHVASGVYYCEMIAGVYRGVRKISLVR